MIRQARSRMHRFYAVWDGAHAGTLAQTGSFAATASDIVPTALFVEDNRASFRFFNASNVSVASPCQVQLPLGTPEHVGLDGTLVAAEENVRPWKIATLSWEMTQ
jgi:hypothetical protein